MMKKIISKRLWLIVMLLLLVFAADQKLKAQNWAGVDEAVVERFAEEHGRKAQEPLIHGDLLLFIFLLAGATGGFVFGFYWRRLFCEIKKKDKQSG